MMSLNQIKQKLPYGTKKFLWNLTHPQQFYRMQTAQIHPNPIFILGHHKSGTTAIAMLLSKISGENITIDLFYKVDPNGKNRKNLDKLFKHETQFIDFVKANKFYFSTRLNKSPRFSFFYEDLQKYFSNAQFIFIIRDPRDTLRSLLNRRGILGNLEDTSENQKIANFPPTAEKHYIKRLANRWCLAAETYLANKEEMVLVRYEDFLLDKVGVIADLGKQVGLKCDRDISAYLDRQYQPRGDQKISWHDFFGAKNLALVEEICLEKMQHFGYPLSSSLIS